MYDRNSPIYCSVSPWQEEEMRQLGLERERAKRPRCVCCGEAVMSERYLDLEDFGLKGAGCERCVEKAMEYND